MGSFIRFWLFLTFFSSYIIYGQEKKIDSLYELFKQNQFNNLLKAENDITNALTLSKEISSDSLSLTANYFYVDLLVKKRQIEKALEKSLLVEELAQKLNSAKYKCLNHLHFSEIYRRQRSYDKSLQNIEKGLLIAKENNFTTEEHLLLNSKAILLKRTKNIKKSKKLLRNILKSNAYKNSNALGLTYNSLAGLYFSYEKNKDSGAYFYKKGLELLKDTDSNYIKTILYLNYGDLLLQDNKEYEALTYLNKAEQIAKDTHNNSSLFFINASLAVYYDDQKNYDEAIARYKQAVENYGKYADGDQLANIYWLSSGAMWQNKNYKEGFIYQEKLIELKDSLFTSEKNKTFEKLQTEYEVEKKNNQIAFLEKEQKLEAKQKQLVFGIGALLLAILGLLVFVYKNKVRSEKLIREKESKLFQQEKAQLEQDQKIKRIEGYIEGEEKEKNRIAMELHDGIGGQLSGIKHYIASLPKNEETKVVLENVGSVSKEVRLLSHSLSSNFSRQQSFATLLQTLQQQYRNHFEIEVVLFPEEEIDTIDKEQKLFLYRTIQEILNNTYKHAQANSVALNLTITDEVVLIVEDNGKGFSTNSIPKGIGLQNIQEKLKTLNGTFEIDTAKGKGTTVIVKLPK